MSDERRRVEAASDWWSDLLQAMASTRWCVFKNTCRFDDALAGYSDLDILVAPENLAQVRDEFSGRGFVPAHTPASATQPGVTHFLRGGPDAAYVINLHVTAQLFTGDDLLESFALPVADRILETRNVDDEGVARIDPQLEYGLFVVRHLIKHTTLYDLYRAGRLADRRVAELQSLQGRCNDLDMARAVATLLPELSEQEMLSAAQVLSSGTITQRIRSGFRMRRLLARYDRLGRWSRFLLTARVGSRMLFNKLRHRRHMRLDRGGLVIAFVGYDATARSALARSVTDWLSQELSVARVDVGRPPPNLVSWLPNGLLSLAERLFPGQHACDVETTAYGGRTDVSERTDAGQGTDSREPPIRHLLRSALLAYDRQRLLARMRRFARRGGVVVADGFPAVHAGTVDSQTLDAQQSAAQRSGARRWLMAAERHSYQRIAAPDLVVRLTVSIDEAERRDSTPHARHVCDIDPSQALDAAMQQLRREIWRTLPA